MRALEGLFIGEIVANYGGRGVSIVEGDHGPESFTTTGVPNVKLDLGAVGQGHCLLEIGSADGHIVTL